MSEMSLELLLLKHALEMPAGIFWKPLSDPCTLKGESIQAKDWARTVQGLAKEGLLVKRPAPSTLDEFTQRMWDTCQKTRTRYQLTLKGRRVLKDCGLTKGPHNGEMIF